MPHVEHEPRQLIVGAGLMLTTGMVQTLAVVFFLEVVENVRGRVSNDMTRMRMIAVLSAVIFYLFALHILEMSIWAAFYASVAGLPSFATALYESALAFTTMDIAHLPVGWKFLSAAEAVTGLLMFAWSTSILFNQTSWVTEARHKYYREHHPYSARDSAATSKQSARANPRPVAPADIPDQGLLRYAHDPHQGGEPR